MRFMMLVKANRDSEAGVLPTEQVLAEMGTFNEEMVKAGVMRGGEGLHPTSKGTRVRLSGGKFTLTDGPFAESKELIAGFWIIEVKSTDEAIAWARRAPGAAGEIELREMFGGSEPIPFATRDETKRRYMTIYKPADSSGRQPTQDEMASMGKFIEEEIKAGALLETGGLLPGVSGVRVAVSGKTRTVIDGPFTEAKEVIGGYAILQASSTDEVTDMTKRFLEVAGDGETEIRPVYELSDFPAGDAIDHHARLRDELARN